MFRLGRSPKITREVARHSASAVLSDEIEELSSSDTKSPSAPPKSKKATLPANHTVSEPKHKAASKYCAELTASMSSLGDFLNKKAAMDDKKFMLIEEKAAHKRELDEWKRALDEKRERMDMVKAVLSMEGASDEVKAAANKYLLNLFI